MSSRLALESWQLALPAIGLAIFAAIFFGVVFRVWRMKRPAVGHLESLPLEEESSHRVGDGSLSAEASREGRVPSSFPNPHDQCHCEERSDEAIHPAGSPRPRPPGCK